MSHTVQELNAVKVIEHQARKWDHDTDSKKRPPHIVADRLGACIRAVQVHGHVHKYPDGVYDDYVVCSARLTEYGSCPGVTPVKIEVGYSTKPVEEITDDATGFRHPQSRMGIGGVHDNRTMRSKRGERA